MKKMPMSRVIPILTLFTLSTALTACGSGGGSKSMYASTMAVTENTAAAYDRAYDRAPIPAGANGKMPWMQNPAYQRPLPWPPSQQLPSVS